MNERNTLVLGALIGAVVGVGVGYFLFTEQGRQLRKEMKPELDAIVQEAVRLGSAVQDVTRGASAAAREVVNPQGWPRRTS